MSTEVDMRARITATTLEINNHPLTKFGLGDRFTDAPAKIAM